MSGVCSEGILTCTKHIWQWDLRTGGELGDAEKPLALYPTKRVGDEVWIDVEDYSIVRIHGSPAKRPSFWTLHTEIDRRYRKINDMWLPDRLDSSSNILIAGQSVLSIEYSYESVQTATEDRKN